MGEQGAVEKYGSKASQYKGDEYFIKKRGLGYFKCEWGRVFDSKGEQSLWRGEWSEAFLRKY